MADSFISGPVRDVVELAKEHVGPRFARWLTRLILLTAILGCFSVLASSVAWIYAKVAPVAAGVVGSIPSINITGFPEPLPCTPEDDIPIWVGAPIVLGFLVLFVFELISMRQTNKYWKRFLEERLARK